MGYLCKVAIASATSARSRSYVPLYFWHVLRYLQIDAGIVVEMFQVVCRPLFNL